MRPEAGNAAEPTESPWPEQERSAASGNLCRFGGPAPDVAFLHAYDVSGEVLAFAAQNAAHCGTSPRDELFALGFPRDRYWQLLAEALGLAFIGDLANATHVSNSGILTTDAVRHAGYALARIDGRVVQVLAPDAEELAALRHRLDVMPVLAERTRIASPETIRGFIVAHRHSVLIHYAVNRLARVMPRLSSSRRAKGASGPMALLASVLAIGLVAPFAALAGIGLLATLFFLNCSVWKLATAFRRRRPLRLEPLSSDRLPAYSVLVPLYREAGIVGDLVANLRELDYPALCINGTKRLPDTQKGGKEGDLTAHSLTHGRARPHRALARAKADQGLCRWISCNGPGYRTVYGGRVEAAHE